MAEPRRGGSPAPPAKSPGPAAPPCAATVNGRRDGNRVVHLGAQLQAWPEELLRQRRGRDGQPEYLVRWSIASLEGRAAGGSGASGAETKPESISVWMSAEEVCASCPALLGERGLEGQGGKGEKAASPLAADAPPEDASLLEMKADVRSLVQRAGRQLAESGAPESSVLNTIHVLSAYAGIGSLAGAFKEAGALDLLMRMLCHKEKRIRRGAGEMLRALAAHDAGSRAYVLLSLSRQDGIEQHMDFDSRYTLLELFAETTSSEEHCMSFEGIHLPQQIPGKLLFVLVKRYLCVTSLLDKLSGGVEREDCAEPGLLTEERSHVKQEFEFSMAVANLILELVHVMGWDRSPKPELQPHHDRRPRATHSIFQHRAAPCTAAQAALAPPPKEPSTFKTRSAFPSRSSYVEYVQAKLVRGMRVRMLEDYEQVSAGDEGDFCQSNDGTPPVQVYWQALGCTYWVHWHMVEIIGAPGQEEHEGQEKVSLLTRNHKLAAVAQPFLRQPLGGLYSLPYLGEQPPEAAEALSRAEWWELLFFVKKLEAQEQKELFSLIQQARGEQLSEGDEEALIRLSVPAALAPKVLQVLEERCQGGSRRDLRVSHTYTKYALGRGAGQDGGGSTAASPKGAGCRSAGPGARAAEAAEEAPAAAPAAAAKADAQLFGELLEREGLALPEVPEEQLRGGEAPRAPGDVRALLGGPGDGELAGEAVAALERQLCGGGAGPSGEAARLLQDRGCFGLVLRSLELLGAEKPASLSVLRILSGFLAASRGDALPWHECVEPCLASLSAHSSDREVVREVVGFLHRLASSSKDCAVAMCRLGARETLAKALAKQGTAPPLAPALLALVTDCEEHAGLYQKLTSSVLAGCMQLVLGQIEEHRRSQRPISIPLFDVFLRNLCRGSGVEVKEDKCWEKVQVSSNPHRAGKLTDRNPKTYWESNGSSGSHFITVHMQRGVVVREMSMLVASEDSSYMPARVVVLGGDSPAAVRTELNAVTVLPSDSRVVLLENMTRFWPVLQIRVKRCQQGGIDTRVRGIEVLGPKPTLWPVFKEQLCRRTFLSCTARAHAWCQEICRDRGRLLQLFGKLNRALRHEQAFADRFLPDDEAAWALGRTFWEALVTPLVQSITSPDPQGVSPLAWLLSEYLESAELSGHAASRGAVFGSRVRRLTQLLVHVDPRGAEPEEARAAGGKDGRDEEVPARAAEAAAKSSGLRSIWRCWRDVVQRQVQRFLEAAGQAPDLVERYCGLYRRLRAATEELFGRQAAFVLALGRGFAGALLQLPFLTALHVSERFARYLDGRIRELRGAAGSAEPPQRLQQLLEPFAVLGGLELAHPFEHFYRHYLGDRLLAQGPSWLEGAVAEQLGLCFPSRFPQEMLSDLAESEELRQQFGLFQLQERDRRLLELEAGPGEAPGPASAAAAPEVAPEVKVLALSPRCWPVPPSCSMAEPGRFFSAALSSPLAAFADFCRRRQLRPGRAGAKPRRLQWTWLGRAELRFGDCVLHVSTLQMYILLRFNDAEEVAVEALLQATGLPAALVHQALTPLTRSEGVLARSRTPGAPGVLRLNRAALAQASGRPLRLLPQQRYLRAERAEVGSLERKRNVLCCLITRILKAEKQLHIDNLVFKVVDACQKGELGPRLQFLSFCCHSVDVLSCVLHLLNQGYLRRQEARPHVLEYVSAEPATPPASQLQPQVAFQTVEIKRAASPASAERRQTFSTFR
ncbi:cullin-9-like isoform X12 [Tyto alba]|uniref:cullin-9-like isoform X12 n=1 Tax=Tyto alba TaxID=56313 RepID=UPI001C672C0A|nr:cullin-9-like isoform X12 [Tyto alba]